MSSADRRFHLRGGGSVGALLERLRHRAAPNHWTVAFGTVSAACVVVLIITGAILMVSYDPSGDLVVYDGPYALLQGVSVSRAFASVLHLCFAVTGGLLVRQLHHWAALVLPASVTVQLLSTFFTGAFRRPRRGAWLLLLGVFLVAILCGWSGYALPDDSLSGTGLRIAEGVMLGLPLIGSYVAAMVFGGPFPGDVVSRLYPIHLAGSAVLVAIMVFRAVLSWRERPLRSAVAVPVWPTAAVRSAGLGLITTGVLIVMAAMMQISPVWMYGPSSPGNAFAGSQPDWYTAFLDGALRLTPGWELVGWGRTWPLAIFVPVAAVGLFLTLVAIYPYVEERITTDRDEHHQLQRPRDAPARTALGAAGMTFYGVLWAAGSADIIATQFHVRFEDVIWVFRVLIIPGPVIAAVLVRQGCLALLAHERERETHGVESGVIVRLPTGGYAEVVWTPAPALPPGSEHQGRSVDPGPEPEHGQVSAGTVGEDEALAGATRRATPRVVSEGRQFGGVSVE